MLIRISLWIRLLARCSHAPESLQPLRTLELDRKKSGRLQKNKNVCGARTQLVCFTISNVRRKMYRQRPLPKKSASEVQLPTRETCLQRVHASKQRKNLKTAAPNNNNNNNNDDNNNDNNNH